MTNFVHLHAHSDYSLKDAAVSVKQLVNGAEALGMTHLALTDHGNMFGIMEFITACKKKETYIDTDGKQQERTIDRIKPIIGCEMYVSPGSRFEKKGSESENRYYHMVLLAENYNGYKNLVKLCTFAYTEGFYHRARIDEELLREYHGGLIALSACVAGEIPMLIQAGKIAEAEQKALYYRGLFGTNMQGDPNFYLEIQDHGIPADKLKGDLSQREINKEIIAIARKTGIPLVATNDVHYLKREDHDAHDLLICIGTAKFRSEEKRIRYHGDQFYLKSGDEMAELFPSYPESLENTVAIARRCTDSFMKPNKKTGEPEYQFPTVAIKDLPQYLPDFEIPSHFDTADSYLRHIAAEGLAGRYPKEKKESSAQWQNLLKRLETELEIIISMGFTGYFLIVENFIRWARDNNIPVGPGRGSGVGSIVAYSMGITNVDPIKYNLLFERFLNPERVSMPDFDIDFANEGRNEVIKYVTEKYGKDRVSQIITFQTMGAKQVIRDVARTLGIPLGDAERIAKLIPDRPGVTLKDAFSEEPLLHNFEQDPQYAELFTFARKLEGLNRQNGLHASGVVIGKDILYNLAPLYKDTKTEAIATQYDLNHLEKCGLVKMDFLGLKTLDVIKHTEELIRQRGGEYGDFSVETVPEDDEATFKMLGEGQSFEVFQFESDGMQNNLRQTRPGRIEDLIALNALYRPGPMKYIPQFISCKTGQQKITYPDPSLEGILRETYGVIVYQEQVMQAAQIIAGFSLGHADELRRAMGKKDMKKMAAEKELFIAGATGRGYSNEKADYIFEMLKPFAEYGFNKSHAAAYTILAYRTAYLKMHFPAEFMAANMTNEINSTDKLPECIDEARKMGIAIDPPDINRSDKFFTISGGRIVYGLLGIKYVGEPGAVEIVRCRADGPYKDFFDFLNRVDIKLVGKASMEKLIMTGAFDCFGIGRGKLLGNLERAIGYAQKQKEDRKNGQNSLFGDTGEKVFDDFQFEDFAEKSRLEKLKDEKQLIGFYISGHPMDEYKALWEKAVKIDLGLLAKGELNVQEPGSQILMGMVKEVKEIPTSKGEKMAYVTIADYKGEIDAIFFPRTWEFCRSKIEADEIAIIRGKIDYQEKKDRYSFIADSWIDSADINTVIAEEEVLQRKREKYRQAWLYMADLKSGSLSKAKKGSYTVIGQLISIRPFTSRKNEEYARLTLRDFEGDVDLTFLPKPWSENRELIAINEFVALKGSFDPDDQYNAQKPSLLVTSIADLNALSRSAARKAEAGEKTQFPPLETHAPKENIPEPARAEPESPSASLPSIHIVLDSAAAANDKAIIPLRNFLNDNAGLCPVYIHIGEKTIRANSGIKLDAEVDSIGILESCQVVDKVWIDQ